jgi:hypothetical protein
MPNRKCKALHDGVRCSVRFEAKFQQHQWCSDECMDLYAKQMLDKVRAKNEQKAKKAKADKEKAVRKDLRTRKAKLKTKSEYKKEAQAEFNKFIRLRDKDLPCVSCGIMGESGGVGGYWDAGHYRSRGANPELAFVEDNCHKQCKRCNQQLSGNVVNYRIELERRIGKDRLEWLEGSHEMTHYGIEDYKRIKAEYKQKQKDLLNDDN